MAPSLRQSQPRHISYKEQSSSEDETVSSASDNAHEPSRSMRTSHQSQNQRSHRQTNRRISYKEPSSDEDSASDDSADFHQPPPKRVRLSRSSQGESIANSRPRRMTAIQKSPRHGTSSKKSSPKRVTRSRDRPSGIVPSISSKSTQPGRRAQYKSFGAPRPPRGRYRPDFINRPVLSDNKIPPWTSLPYEILTSIFAHASYPLRDPTTMLHTPSVMWLLNASCTCKTFYDPAMTAFYKAPPLSRIPEPHDLLDLLQRSEGATSIDYTKKVKRLEFEAKMTLSYSVPGRGPFNLPALIEHTPLVSEIEITDSMDRPPYRQSGTRVSYTYPDDLFASLNRHQIRLKRWRWNGVMFKGRSLTELKEIHSSDCFGTLQHLAVSHLDVSVRRSSNKSTPRHLDTKNLEGPHAQFVDALRPLKHLKSLSLESINAGDFDDFGQWDWITLLPTALERLTIVNAPYLTGETMESFLTTHGHHMKELDLSHNQQLDLNYLGTLQTCCPNLEVLRMDCTYYSPHELSKDSDPLYDTLLDPDIVPTWPSTLRELELVHLRKWESSAAATFFTSLIDAASALPALRKVNIKAMLNIGWRDRAGFRDRWISRMQAIFRDNTPPPNPHLASYRTWREWLKQAPTRSHAMDERTRLETARPYHLSEDDALFLDGRPVQGRCSVVEVNVDNLRPTEYMFTEQDFMDSELSGDEEWQGDGQPSSPRYAW